MENKVITKELKVCLERLPMNLQKWLDFYETEIRSHETTKETCSKNTSFIDDGPKKRVSFSKHSSILYYDDDEATNVLQNSFSEVLDHSVETSELNKTLNDARKLSNTERDFVVILEKLPQISLEEYINKTSNHDGNCPASNTNDTKHSNSVSNPIEEEAENTSSKTVPIQEFDQNACSSEDSENTPLLVHNKNEYPVRDAQVLIQRLPDNLFKMHWNCINSETSPEITPDVISKKRSKKKSHARKKKLKMQAKQTIDLKNCNEESMEDKCVPKEKIYNKTLCVHLERLDLQALKQSTSKSSQISQSCSIEDSSSDDDLPLFWLSRNLSIQQQTLYFDAIKNLQNESQQPTDHISDTEDSIPLSCLKTVNSVKTPTILTRSLSNIPALSPVSVNSSEENCPLPEVDCLNKSLPTNKSKKKKKRSKPHANIALSNKKYVSMDHCYFKSLDHQIVVDHSYHLPLSSNSRIKKSALGPKKKKSGTKLQTGTKKYGKKDGDVLKKKKSRKIKNSMILVDSLSQNKGLLSKANMNLSVNSRNNGPFEKESSPKKKKWDKKVDKKSQTKVYKMMLKYLQKQIKSTFPKVKSYKKAKKVKDGLTEKYEENQSQPLNISEDHCSSTDTADEAVEMGTVCVVSQNQSSGSFLTENTVEVAFKSVVSSQNGNIRKSKDGLTENYEERKLQPLNIKVKQESECVGVETGAVCALNENDSSGSLSTERAIEVASEAVCLVDSIQCGTIALSCQPANACQLVKMVDGVIQKYPQCKNTEKSKDGLTEKYTERQLQHLNIKIEPDSEYIIDTVTVETGSVCMVNKNSCFELVSTERPIEVASEAVSFVDSFQNISAEKSKDGLTEQCNSKQLRPIIIKVQSDRNCIIDNTDETGTVCVISKYCSSGSTLTERTIEVESERVCFVDSSQKKNVLTEQSKETHLQPLNIKAEPENDFNTDTADEEVETRTVCAVNENCSSGLALTERKLEVASKRVSFVDSSQNKKGKKRKYDLTEQSEENHLQHLNIKAVPEVNCIIDSTDEAETEAVSLVSKSSSPGSTLTESTIEISSKRVCFVDSSQNKKAKKEKYLTEQSKENNLQPLNIKTEPEMDSTIDDTDEAETAVPVISKNSSPASTSTESPIEISSKTVCIVDSSLNKKVKKEKYDLTEQSKDNNLQPLNIKAEPEMDYIIDSTDEAEMEAVPLISKNNSSVSETTDNPIEISSNRVCFVDSSQNKKEHDLTEQSKEKHLQPLNVKTEPEMNFIFDSPLETGAVVCVGNEICSSGLALIESTEVSSVCFVDGLQKKNANQQFVQEKAVDKYQLGFRTQNKSVRFYNKLLASERLLFSKYKIKKKQRKELKKIIRTLKKVCHIK